MTHLVDEIVDPIIGSTKPVRAIVLEGWAGRSGNSGSLMLRAEIVGAVKYICDIQNGIPIYIAAPNALKKFATGFGAGAKDGMWKVAAQHGFMPESDDEVDAYFCAGLAAHIAQGVRVDCSFSRFV